MDAYMLPLLDGDGGEIAKHLLPFAKSQPYNNTVAVMLKLSRKSLQRLHIKIGQLQKTDSAKHKRKA